MNTMMRILIVNPNTSEHFNRLLRATAKSYALDSTQLRVISPKSGPSTIEGVYDEALSIQGTVKVFLEFENEFDGCIIACFSDHLSVYALREITRKPVIGIAEAAIHLACLLGNKFSIVTTNARWEPLLSEAVKKYGVGSRCASVRVTNLPVSDFEDEGNPNLKAAIEAEAHAAVNEDGAEVICLGCAGMSGFDKELQKKLDVPVLDGVVCALKLLELFHQCGLTHSKVLTYSAPLWKELTNLSPDFAKAYTSEKNN